MSRSNSSRISRQRTLQQQQQQICPLLLDGSEGDGVGTQVEEDIPPITCTSTSQPTTTAQVRAGGEVAMDTGGNGRHGLIKRQSMGSLRNAWRLKYQDFLPGKPNEAHWNKSDTFR